MKVLCISEISLIIIIGFTVLNSYSGQWEVFTNKNDVRDIALSGNTLWAATGGGVVKWNLSDNSYTSYTTADGLLSCNINQVAIDNKGRPWVATKEPCGLFIYENPTWKQMDVGNVDIENINQIIFGLEVDQFGNVWIFVKDETGWLYLGGCGWILDEEYLWRYDGRTWHKHEGVYGPVGLDPQKNLLAVDSLSCSDKLELIRFGIASFNGSDFVSKWLSKVNNEKTYLLLRHSAQDSKGNIWFSSLNERTGETNGVVCNNITYTTLDGLADDAVWSITSDESCAVWCATDGGISKFTGKGWVTYDTADGVASNRVYKILIGDDKTVYAATSKGISILKSDQWKTLKTINEPSHNNYTDMVIDKRGKVILSGTDHIAMYSDLQWKLSYFRNIRVGESYYQHFPRNFKNKSFIKSKDGTLYAIGNEIEGGGCILKQGTGGNTFFKEFSYTTKKHPGFSSPAVVCSSNDSSFWLTGGYDDLILVNKQTTENFHPSRFDVGKYPEITCMLLDRNGRSVWVGYDADEFNPAGIVHFDSDTVKKRINVNDGLASGHMTAIARDSSKNLWFASRDKYEYQSGGVSVLRDTKLTTYLMDSDGRVFGGCNALFVDNLGIVWTHADNGIARFDGSSWKLFECSTVSPDLPYARYSHINQDKSGTVWFGTSGSGLLAYKDSRWYQITTRNGIPHNRIRSLEFDSKDNLWILTDHGIAMRKSGGMVHNLARGDFVDPGYKRIIKQRGSRFYVSSNNKPDMIRYILFDLRGRAVYRQTIHRRKSFVLPKNYFSSGLRILSITIEDTNGSQNKYLFKMGDIK